MLSKSADIPGCEPVQNLNQLECSRNQLTSLDVSKKISELYCYSNQLTTLDVSKNKELSCLYCDSNRLTTLDVSHNPSLYELECYSNPLTRLDVSRCKALCSLVKENPRKYNPYFDCDDHGFSFIFDSNVTVIAGSITSQPLEPKDPVKPAGVMADAVHFPNEYFRTGLMEYDLNQDGYLDDEEIENIVEFGVGAGSVEGIQYLKNLKILHVTSNEQLKELDLSKNTQLEEIYCQGCSALQKLDISKCTKLRILWCSACQLTSLDVSNNQKLEKLYCNSNRLKSLDVSTNKKLVYLSCGNNPIKKLTMKNKKLERLDAYGLKIKTLDLRKCPILAAKVAANPTPDCEDDVARHDGVVVSSSVKIKYQR